MSFKSNAWLVGAVLGIAAGLAQAGPDSETVKLFKDTGKVWFTADEKQIQKLREIVFPDGHLNKDAVGRSPREIGAMAGTALVSLSRLISRSSVVLPEPDGPTIARNSRSATASVTSSSARTPS